MDPTQDRDSPEAVIRRYSDMVYRLAFARTGNRSDAEDLYQEVFLRYLTRAPAFTSEDHRKAWLLRVAVNCANRFHTAPWRKRTEPLSEALSVPAPEGEDLWEELRRLPGPHRSAPLLLRGHDHRGDRSNAGPEPGHGALPAAAGEGEAEKTAGGGGMTHA